MEARTVGDYRLIEPLETRADHLLWRAEQTSVGRDVLVVELTDPSRREAFLANIRAKAAVDHPLIGSVYEAISDDHHCLAAMERLSGDTLAEHLESGRALTAAELATLLRRVAEATLHLESHGIASDPLAPHHIHFDEHGVVRLSNLARAGHIDPATETLSVSRLGQELWPLVAEGQPGSSRTQTVLAWMRGDGLEAPLTWQQVLDYALQIEAQLTEDGRARTTHRSPRLTPWLAAALLLIGSLAVGAWLWWSREPQAEPAARGPLPDPIALGAGTHTGRDGRPIELDAFRLAAHEVTIGQYADFLETLTLLDPESRSIYDHPDQPEDKTSHEPDDWAAMLEAARQGATWQGLELSIDCPVVNVDWFDATAYCDWKRGALPTEEQWFAALSAALDDPSDLDPARWGPVHGTSPSDLTPNGLHGMAGRVSEWSRDPVINPANPLGRRQYLLLGASFQDTDRGARDREWTDDRLLRRKDLGFRVAWPERSSGSSASE